MMQVVPEKTSQDIEWENYYFLEIRINRLQDIKSLSTRGPGRRDTCHLTDSSQTFTDD